MRRPHVYERSAHRGRKEADCATVADYRPAARAALAALPALLAEAEACGAFTLARHLGQALTEAEGIVNQTKGA